MDEIISRCDSLTLRFTKEWDLDFVLNAEGALENSKYVYQWTREQHLRAMEDRDIIHIIIEKNESKCPVGYMILSGTDSPNHNIELKRIVVDEKGKGFGRETLRLVKKLSFGKLNAHRLWLDVKDHNHKAIELYRSEGFIEEGVIRECVYYEGEYESMIVMSMLENEYKMNKQGGEIMLSDLIKSGFGENEDLNCAEKILYAANKEYDLKLEKSALKLAAGFGGGMAIGDKCGALTASIMVLGRMFVKNNAHESEKIKILTKEIFDRYKEDMGSLDCEPLKEQYRTEEVKCKNVILKAAEILDEIIQRELGNS